MADFTLPELGENVTAGDVLRVLVKPGDTVTKDQTVLELETDKATIEVPSSVAGRVTTVAVKAGRQGQGRPGGPERRGRRRAQATGDGDKAKAAAKQEDAPSRKTRSRKTRSRKKRSRQRRRRPKRSEPGTTAKIPDGGLEQHAEGPKRAAAPGGKDKSGKKEKADPPASPESAEQDGGMPTERARPSAAAGGEQCRRHQPRRAPERRAGCCRDAAGSGGAVSAADGAGARRRNRERPRLWSRRPHFDRGRQGAGEAADRGRRPRRRPRRPPSRSLISRAGAKSSDSRCVRCGGRRPST